MKLLLFSMAATGVAAFGSSEDTIQRRGITCPAGKQLNQYTTNKCCDGGTGSTDGCVYVDVDCPASRRCGTGACMKNSYMFGASSCKWCIAGEHNDAPDGQCQGSDSGVGDEQDDVADDCDKPFWCNGAALVWDPMCRSCDGKSVYSKYVDYEGYGQSWKDYGIDEANRWTEYGLSFADTYGEGYVDKYLSFADDVVDQYGPDYVDQYLDLGKIFAEQYSPDNIPYLDFGLDIAAKYTDMAGDIAKSHVEKWGKVAADYKNAYGSMYASKWTTYADQIADKYTNIVDVENIIENSIPEIVNNWSVDGKYADQYFKLAAKVVQKQGPVYNKFFNYVDGLVTGGETVKNALKIAKKWQA